MKKLIQSFLALVTIIVTISDVLLAQPNYNFSSSAGAYISIVGQPGTLPFNWRVTTSPNDEDFTFPLTIQGPNGFLNPFPYDGVLFKEIQVSCNGFLKFCNSLTGDTLSTSKTTGATNRLMAFTRNVLAPLWDDNAVNNAVVDIVYQFAGPPGNRVLTIEWNNVKWSWTSAVVSAGFQIRLYENNSWIEYHYGNFPNAPTSASASVGMNDGTPISSTTSGVEATGTFLSINFGGTPAARTFHRSYGYEYFSITAGPDPVGPLPANTTIFTFMPQVPVPMVGAYKVGGAPTPPFWFARLSDAAEALNLNGVGGPVILNLWPGPDLDPGQAPPVWDDIFHLINVTGTSAINNITVQVDPQYGGQVTISPRNGTVSTNSPSATAGDAMIRLDGTRYTTITGMNGLIRLVNNTQNGTTITQCEMGIFLGNAIVTTFNNPSVITGAQWNVFHNLYIDMNNSLLAANNGGAIGIRFGTNGPNADPLQANSNNTISDCEITDFYRAAVYMFGFSSAVPDFGNTITGTFFQGVANSKFHDATLSANIQDCRAIEAYDQKNLLIENTDVYNIIATALVTNGPWGIRINPSAGDGTSGTCIIRHCNVYNVENQGAQVTSGFACGIEVTSPYHEGTVVIYNNKVYDIFSNGSTTCRAVGMQLSLGAGGNSGLMVYNNYVYDLRAPRSTSNPGIRGLDIQSSNNVLTAQVYYNTVYLDSWTSPPQLASQYSTCLYLASFGTSSLDLRNNILVTDCSAGLAGTGIATCIYASANTNLLRLASTTNNNYLFANGPSPNRPIAYDVTFPAYQTLAAYQTAVATGGLGGPRDAQAVTLLGVFPPFFSGAPPYNLHLNPAVPSEAESGALPILGVGTDWDGNVRNPNFPDIGADEYNGVLVADVIAPQIFYTPLPNQNTPLPPVLVATITDPSGIPPGIPTLWHKRTIDLAWVPVPGVPGPGPNDYTFPFNYAFPAPPVTVGDVVQYYIGAQDFPGNVGTNPTGGGGTPPPGLIPPALPNTFNIIAPPYGGGTYGVGWTKFNEVTGRQLYPQTLTKVVREKVRAERNIEVQNTIQESSSELIDLSLKPGMDQAYSFDETKYSPTEFVWRDVVKEYVLFMENGQVYTGPQYVTVEELKQQGRYTEDMKGLIGFWTTLKGAADSLNLHGISGAVTIELRDAVYNGETYPIDFNSIAGVSAANTITIKPKAGVQPVFSNAAAQIKITNTSYFTIDGSNTAGGTTRDLTINRSGATAGPAVWIGSLGTTTIGQIAVTNCNIYTGETTGSTPIIVSDGTTSGSSGYFSTIMIKNNELKKGRQGIYVNGGIIPQYGSNIIIQDNILNATGADQLKIYGIYTQGCNGVVIINNDVGNFEVATAENDRGIWVAAGTINATVEKNKIHDIGTTATGSGGNGIAISSSSISCNNVVKNNFIYRITGTGSNTTLGSNPLGIYIFGAQTNLGVFNNSIYLVDTLLNVASSGIAFSCGICLGTGTYADVRNNIISNSLGPKWAARLLVNGAMGVYAISTLAQFTTLSNNVYYINPTWGSKSFGHINGLGYLGFNLPLASWQANTGKDANSQSGNPKYTNPATGDLHILTTTGTLCESAGTPVAAVVDDIDGNLRNAVTPDVGADEFAGTQFMTLNLTAYIQGFYDGNGTMVSDTVDVSIRNTTSPYTAIETLRPVLNASGQATLNFRDPVIGTNYYIAINHRNSIFTWSKSGGESWAAFTLNYNFTTAQSQAYGSNAVNVGGEWCIYNGDVVRDEFIDGSDVSACFNDANLGTSGYVVTDLTGDDFVDGTDVSLAFNNSNLGVGASYPTKKLFVPTKIETKRPEAE